MVDDLRNGFACNEPLIAAKQSAYDRFSRTEQSLWLKDTGPGFNPLVHVQWGYDRNSLRTWRKDLLAPTATAQDQAFLYDQLQQIVNRQRGVLNINHTAAGGIPAQTEHWDHDEQGNWRTYDTTEDGQPAIEQTRGHNTSNQITKIDGSSANVAHDANGNMTLVPTSAPTGPRGNLEGPPLKTTWDAWDRTRLVHDQNNVLIQDNRYDGLTRRTQEITAAGTRHFFYNDQWRSVEERLGTATTPERQHIWHPADRWTMIRRDRDTTGNGTLDEHLWCLKDDLDPVAIADHTGAIAERYAYSAFGIATFLTPAFEPRSGNQSHYDWNFLSHAEFTDDLTGWMNYHYRNYSPELGRWISRDPTAEDGGVNLYGFVGNGPLSERDVFGLTRASVMFTTEIRPPSIPPSGMKTFHQVIVDIVGGEAEVVFETDIIGPTVIDVPASAFQLAFQGGGRVSTRASCDAYICKISFVGSVYAKPLGIFERVISPGSQPAGFVIDYVASVSVDLCQQSGTYRLRHDGYPSYVLRINGDDIYDFQQINIGRLAPPMEIFDMGAFSL